MRLVAGSGFDYYYLLSDQRFLIDYTLMQFVFIFKLKLAMEIKLESIRNFM